MPRPSKRPSASSLSTEAFQKAINIVYDADEPERIAHYYPTAKGAGLTSKLLGEETERAFMVFAPYGSGKSLAAALALHSLENRKEARPVLKEIVTRLEPVDIVLASRLAERQRKYSHKGLVVALVGHQDDFASSLLEGAAESFSRHGNNKAAAGLRKRVPGIRKDISAALDALKEVAAKQKIDRVAILWDEFGRHLEMLISDGRTAELMDLQTCAEFVSRQKKLPHTLSVFLHQGLLDYATHVPQNVRAEWRKIEGRFEAVEYVEDGKEIYRLISEIVSSRRISKPGNGKIDFGMLAQRWASRGAFAAFPKPELATLFRRAFPLTPACLYLLPRVSARVAQNERTLFSFLFNAELGEEPMGPDRVYDYFGEQMRGDINAGGTHRQWLETESAISKVVDDSTEAMALKAACLLSLGLSGERARADRQLVVNSVAGFEEAGMASAVIDALVARKLLLHRKHNDELAIWHGADLDLRGRLEDRKAAQSGAFDLVGFLEREARPPVWKPQRYNDEYSIRRYFESSYLPASGLGEEAGLVGLEAMGLAPDCDGRVIYLLPEDADQAMRASEHVGKMRASDISDGLCRTIFVIPNEPMALRDAALEVDCLLDMQADPEVTGEDPLALPELRQMVDDARDQLQSLLQRLTTPGVGGAAWYYLGRSLPISSPSQLREVLSLIMETIYSRTPKLGNELIVRKRPSPVIVNSRKKFLLALLERTGQEGLGIEGNFPDASMFRTLLKQTGLYRENPEHPGAWSFCMPAEIDEPGLRAVWEVVQEFFTTPAPQGKSPSDLFSRLMAPPCGVRPGLLPIFFAAGFKAFAYTTSLLRDGEYIADVLPSNIELLCKEPERHTLKVLALDDEQLRYVEKVRSLFSGQPAKGCDADLIRNAYDAVLAWFHQLPEAAVTTRSLPEKAKAFRNLILRQKDPVGLLLSDIPRITGRTIAQLGTRNGTHLEALKQPIEMVISEFRRDAESAVRNAIGMSKSDESSTREACERWAKGFAGTDLPKGRSKPLLTRMQMEYDSDEKLIESLASMLGESSLSRWKDEDLANFERVIHEVVRATEASALQGDLSRLKGTGDAIHLARLLRSRINDYEIKLKELGYDSQLESDSFRLEG